MEVLFSFDFDDCRGGNISFPSISFYWDDFGSIVTEMYDAVKPHKIFDFFQLRSSSVIEKKSKRSLGKNALIPVRGGICVHRPSKSNLSINHSNKSQETIETIQSNFCEDKDHFLTFARNIILQTPRNSVVYERRVST